MLAHLLIKNYALIEHLEISPDANLNIITGETGAGKSIMLGALGLLMGKRADGKALYNQEKKCFIEGTFNIGSYQLEELFEKADLDYENPCLIRREIAPSGKSRAFVNDSPVTLDVLKKLSERLLDVHSQHDSILLGESDYQLDLLDAFAENEALLKSYKEDYKVYRAAKKSLDYLSQQATELKKEFDYNSFLLEELSEANLKLNEQEQLQETLDVLENAEEVKLKLNQVSLLLNHPEQSLISALQDASVQLGPIVKYAQVYEDLKKRLLSVQVELVDIAEEVEKYEEDVEHDPEEIEKLKGRLDLIFRLQQKHGVKSIEGLIEIRESLSLKVEDVLNFDDKLKVLTQSLEKAEAKVLKTGQSLSKKRLSVVPALQKRVVTLLKELGIPNADFKIDNEEQPLDKNGINKVEFLFSGNKGFDLQGLRKVASGGEFSRLMLSLKYILAEKTAMPTIIFDEIDTGISGEVAIKMGVMMRQMSQNMQVMAITHLHQIAGKGTSHFFVYKNDTAARTVSSIKKLEENERILEIAKMIGGDNPSDSSIQSAFELLQS
ncbi:DNA repair protein RecN [Arcticibacterium luteifluviistationis]|uniref:DNA repair protein RecN n=1 Tax=Arcticibacterium luteifluviistationis TaxID=1784714 RepID=A0A2Z4G849_9BACT|nr:DNA repair protein RecN [Arcticibacterium luteifluviistationis]AWV97280.1 DNA repair protein RecN [Arcticibacterium luteifluviistationis]